MPFVGFKAAPSGYTGTNPWALKNLTRTKAVAGGVYSWWQVSRVVCRLLTGWRATTRQPRPGTIADPMPRWPYCRTPTR
jgi:hypothetical protein